MNFGTLTFLTGTPGSGKSYSITRYLVDDFLVNSRGLIFTNLPLEIDQIAYLLSKKGHNYEATKSRIVLIPHETLEKWKAGESPRPYLDTYFEQGLLHDSLIVLDEIHEIVPVKILPKERDRLQPWLEIFSTLRHYGSKMLTITQIPDSVNKDFRMRSDSFYTLVNSDSTRAPYLNVSYYDIRQVLTCFFGGSYKSSTLIEMRNEGSTFKPTGFTQRFFFDPRYFRCYNSFNDTRKSAENQHNFIAQEEHERYNPLTILIWFFRRNMKPLFLFLCAFSIFYYMCMAGGLNKTIKAFQRMTIGDMQAVEAKKLGMTLEQYKEKLLIEKIEERIFEKMNTDLKTQEQKILSKIGTVQAVAPVKVNPLLSRKLVYISSDSKSARLDDNSLLIKGLKIGDYEVEKIDFNSRTVLFKPSFLLSF